MAKQGGHFGRTGRGQLFSDLPSSLTKCLIRRKEEARSGFWRTAQEKTNHLSKGQHVAGETDLTASAVEQEETCPE